MQALQGCGTSAKRVIVFVAEQPLFHGMWLLQAKSWLTTHNSGMGGM